MNTKYYVKQQGSSEVEEFNEDELFSKIKQGSITPETYVRRGDSSDWVKCSSLNEFESAFAERSKGNAVQDNIRQFAENGINSVQSIVSNITQKANIHLTNGEHIDGKSAWNPLNAFIHAICNNYVNIGGRASRSEYWCFFMAYCLLMMLLWCIPFVGWLFAWFIFPVALLLPSLAITARRLHDIGKPARSMVFLCIPIVNIVFFFTWFLKEGEGENKYGKAPSAPIAAVAPAWLSSIMGDYPRNVVICGLITIVAALFNICCLSFGGSSSEAERILLERYCITNPRSVYTLVDVARRGNAEMLALLQEAGADLSLRSPDGYSALSAAVGYKNSENVRYLLGQGLNPNERYKGYPLILIAASNRDFKSLESLLNARDTNMYDCIEEDGIKIDLMTIFLYDNDCEGLRLLMRHSYDINRKIYVKGNKVAPILLALAGGKLDFVNALVEAGVDTVVKDSEGLTVQDWAKKISNRQGAQALGTLMGAFATTRQQRMAADLIGGSDSSTRVEGHLNEKALLNLFYKQKREKGVR